MTRTPKIAALNPLAKGPANAHPRRIKPLRRRTPRPRGLALPNRTDLLATASSDCPLVDAQLPLRNGILAGLPDREWSFVRPHLQCVSWHGGEILRDVATPLDCFYFPESGMVCTFAVMDDGKTLALAAIGREGFVGVPAFLGAEIAQLRAVVLVGGNALKLSRDALRRILPAVPQFAAALRRYSSRYLAQIAAIGACHALHSVHQRVASWLLMARDRTGSDSLPLTHQSLSELLGCRRSSVTVSLSLLESAGMIRCGRRQVSILDHKRLEQEACECYASSNKRGRISPWSYPEFCSFVR
jgi:CRP-like cAMP-binding protein